MVDLLHIEPILVIYTFHADNLFHHAILMRLHSFMEKCFVHACYQLEQFLLILCIYFLAVLDLHCFARAVSSCGKEGGYSRLQSAGLSLCGFSSCGTLAWGCVGFSIVARGLRRSAACGSCVWDLPGSGIKPMSPELAGDSYPLSHQGGSKNMRKHHNSLV